MAITQAMVTSFKVGVLDGTFDFSSDTSQTYNLALYTSSATLDATTTAYSTSNEVSGTGYSAGGAALTISANPASSGTTAFLDFADLTFSTATSYARGALIYLVNGGTNPAGRFWILVQIKLYSRDFTTCSCGRYNAITGLPDKCLMLLVSQGWGRAGWGDLAYGEGSSSLRLRVL